MVGGHSWPERAVGVEAGVGSSWICIYVGGICTRRLGDRAWECTQRVCRFEIQAQNRPGTPESERTWYTGNFWSTPGAFASVGARTGQRSGDLLEKAERDT